MDARGERAMQERLIGKCREQRERERERKVERERERGKKCAILLMVSDGSLRCITITYNFFSRFQQALDHQYPTT